jgi:acyl-coenzyme A synthetase/AMP-(fatty) acid ligase
VITQGGGKLTEAMWNTLAQYAQDKGKQFIATYGQSECTARMAYLPAEMALDKVCSIGIAEPGGQLSIIDDNGNEKPLKYKVLLWADSLTQANQRTVELARQGYDMHVEGLKEVEYEYLNSQVNQKENE